MRLNIALSRTGVQLQCKSNSKVGTVGGAERRGGGGGEKEWMWKVYRWNWIQERKMMIVMTMLRIKFMVLTIIIVDTSLKIILSLKHQQQSGLQPPPLLQKSLGPPGLRNDRRSSGGTLRQKDTKRRKKTKKTKKTKKEREQKRENTIL